MKRWVYAFRYVEGKPQSLEYTLLRHSIALLRAATGSPDSPPSADGSYVLELHSRVAGVDLAKRVRVRTGVAYRSGSRVILPIAWHADPARHAFPTFSGTLELEALDAHSGQLTLAGSYDTPLGLVGAAADAALLRNIAQATAEVVARALAEELAKAAGTPPDGQVEVPPGRGEPMLVRDVMTRNPLVIEEDLPLRTAALMLFHAEVSGAPVVSVAGELIGVLSERDLLAKEATRRQLGSDRRSRADGHRRTGRTAGEACTRPAMSTVPGARLAEVARTMLDRDVKRLIVIDEGRIAGIVSRHDVLRALLRSDAETALAVQKVVEACAGSKVDVEVQWGEVTLTGVTDLRSVAERLAEAVAEVDGVIDVDAEQVTWELDDTIAALEHI